MAYANRRGNKPAAPSTGKKGYAFSTGLFAPKKEGVARIAEVAVKEDLVIKAGSYLHLYEQEDQIEGKPIFSLKVSSN